MHADLSRSCRFRQRSVRRPARRGSALLLAIIGIFTVAVLATAAIMITNGESIVAENMQTGTQSLYVADQALSQYYQNFKPGDNLTNPSSMVVTVDTSAGDVDTAFTFMDYASADLKVTDIVNGKTTVRITPYKMMTSRAGDVYLLDALALTKDARSSRPATVRSLRTYARLTAPLYVRAALMAPGGVFAMGKKGDANRIILNGSKSDGCGVASSVPGLATPAGLYNYSLAKKVDIAKDLNGIGHDTSAASYAELRDSLKFNWTDLTNDAYYANAPKKAIVPANYATLQAVPWGNFKRTDVWPVILVHGDVTLTSAYAGFGMLVVDGSLNVTNGVLKWDGLILVGKKLTVVDGKDKSHTHVKGAIASGLNCTTTDLTAGLCRVELASSKAKGEHLGVTYSLCNINAAITGLMSLRPLTPTRHLKLY